MRLVFKYMGPRLSKISYRMSECEKKLGYMCEEDEAKLDQQGAAAAAEKNKETSITSIEEQQPTQSSSSAVATASSSMNGGGGSSSSSQYQSNSSLSSGSGEVTCVQMPWSKSASDKCTKRRKSKGSKSPSPFACTSANPAKLPTKRTKIWHTRFSSGSKKRDAETEATGGKAGPSTCVCTRSRRTASDAGEHPRNQDTATGPTRRAVTSAFTPPGLGVFNPDDYPIEDEDEKMRRQRAKEMEEGVELSDQLRMLSCNGEGSYPQVHTQVDYIHCLVPDLKEITSCSFYWGKIDRYEAEKLLDAKPEGTFLLRDSAQEEYLFSVSFRRYGRSLHARIEQWGHTFSFDAHDPTVFSAPTVTGLIEHYKDPSCCMFFEPMLTTRLHRNFTFDLQHLARSVICNHVTYDAVNSLPLPKKLKTYCKEYHYKQRVRVRHIAE